MLPGLVLSVQGSPPCTPPAPPPRPHGFCTNRDADGFSRVLHPVSVNDFEWMQNSPPSGCLRVPRLPPVAGHLGCLQSAGWSCLSLSNSRMSWMELRDRILLCAAACPEQGLLRARGPVAGDRSPGWEALSRATNTSGVVVTGQDMEGGMQKEVPCKGGWAASWKRDVRPKGTLQMLQSSSQGGSR